MKFTHFGTEYEGQLSAHKYSNNDNLAIELLSWEPEGRFWEPFAKLSVNTDAIYASDTFVAKTYSENEGLVEQFIEAGYFEDTGHIQPCGYVDCPILKITDKFRIAVAV